MRKLALTLALVAVILGMSSSFARVQDNTNTYARVYVWEFVKQRLKSPHTADFSTLRMTKTSSGVWTTDGYVDSQNMYGATMRNYFHCEVQYRGGSWYLIDLSWR